MMKYTNQFFVFALIVYAIIFSSCDFVSNNEEKKTVYFPGSDIIKQVVEYKNGRKNGEFREYYRNGNLKALQRYVQDTLNDTSFLYHENGKRASIQIYSGNQRSGCWQKYNKKGELYWQTCFKNGSYDSTSLRFSYRNLKLIERLNYKEGRKHGKQETFYNSGKPQSVTFFKEGEALPGTEEWLESGKKVNNDFRISIVEQNEVLMKNKLSFIISLENYRPDDELFEVIEYDSDKTKTFFYPVKKKNSSFIIEFDVAKNGFVMKDVKILAKRKTLMGNIVMKTASFVASANNY